METTWTELKDVLLMQGFAGFSLFSVFLLMALGLAIIFGQMKVINMAHGEFLTIGAYVTVFCSQFTAGRLPDFMAWYFPVAIVLAFAVAFVAGYFVEILLIRYLYNRPLDTLLATWGISLIFFLHGAGMSRAALHSGVRNWRLHSVVQGTTFILTLPAA